MSGKLKPCPFCGGEKLDTGGDDKFVGVWCKECQATGPNHYGRGEWNSRADLARPKVKPLVWRPIETAPKDGTGFIAFERISDKHHTISVCVWEDGSEGEGPYMVLFHKKKNTPIAATHWTPLPEPPQEGSEE